MQWVRRLIRQSFWNSPVRQFISVTRLNLASICIVMVINKISLGSWKPSQYGSGNWMQLNFNHFYERWLHILSPQIMINSYSKWFRRDLTSKFSAILGRWALILDLPKMPFWLELNRFRFRWWLRTKSIDGIFVMANAGMTRQAHGIRKRDCCKKWLSKRALGELWFAID